MRVDFNILKKDLKNDSDRHQNGRKEWLNDHWTFADSNYNLPIIKKKLNF